MAKVLAQITMNAGRDIPGSVIRYNLNSYALQFDKVIVVDGNLTEEAVEFYEQFRNLEVVDSPWEDSYIKQYLAWYDRCDEGDWILYLDCDEMPSPKLSNFLWDIGYHSDVNKVDIYKIPCILHLTEDGRRYHQAEGKPKKDYNGQWTKNILLKKGPNIRFRHFGSHVIPETSTDKYCYLPYPYYHLKNLESFVYNDCTQAFLHPEGQRFSPTDARLFKMFTSCYRTTKEFREAMKKGTWPPPLRKFAWDRRHEHGNPVSRLSWAYYILEGHPMPERDEFMEWENVKQYVLDLSVYEENKRQNGPLIEVA